MRVLYVDDDRINTLLFEETCRCAGGIEVACAATGAEALELAAGFAADALVIDLHLPDTNGFELLPALRRALRAEALPAFLCTADEPALVAEQAAAAGFDGCWTKPVAVETMLAELHRADGGPAA
ncbi:response regulator [Rubrivivax gelatinosus]|jgi:CheY-like chemotaxis protein|uniref:Response regulator n=1 Tax=Rubrivivax gelatinosus TaxID=28068 RepID=A0ABS1DRG2_RUBGE|nr:response regulator [Rubrivivax gelatinosus]MBK1613987.1 response regulator [Rubrivivax gelatinosus]MBK1712587.1 response regulator [Rubrivivax gelatinosus]